MFRKELADVLKQTGYFLAALAGFPTLAVVVKLHSDSLKVLLPPYLQFGLLFWSLFLGASILGRERRQRATEYALSLPYTRLGLLGRLAGPRVFVLLTLAAIFLFIKSCGYEIFALFPPPSFLFLYISLFIISSSLAPLMENFLALCLSTIFIIFIETGVMGLLFWSAYRARGVLFPLSYVEKGWFSFQWFFYENPSIGLDASSWIPAATAILLPFLISLAISFRKFDCRSSSTLRRSYFGSFLLSGLAAAIMAFVLLLPSIVIYRWHNIISGDRVVANTPWDMKVYSPNGSKTIPLKETYINNFLGEAGSKLFWWTYGGISSFDTETGNIVDLYRAPVPDHGLTYPVMTGDKIVFFAKAQNPLFMLSGSIPSKVEKSENRPTLNPKALALIILSLDDRAGHPVRAVLCPFSALDFTNVYAVRGAGIRDGLRFWIVQPTKDRLYKAFENGLWVEIPGPFSQAIRRVIYIDDWVVFSDKDSLKILRDKGTSFELVKTISGAFDMPYFSMESPRALGSDIYPEIFFKNGAHIARLDLKTLEIENIAERPSPEGMFVFTGDRGRYFLREHTNSNILKISSLHGREIQLLREFPDLPIAMRGYRASISEAGMAIQRKNIYQFFAFPDLHEIRCPGLH